MIDQHAKSSDEEFIRSTSARNIIFALERMFILYCILKNIVSDNGPTFSLYEIQEHFAAKGIKHHTLQSRPILVTGKRSSRKIYAILEQSLSNYIPLEERLEI